MILALDTSTALTSAAVIDDDGRVVVERTHEDARRHAEAIGPMIADVVGAVPRTSVSTVACGVGPGPYTGLRVAIASAIAIGAAWDVPVVGLCSLDALAAQVLSERADGQGVEVCSDARRSEVYWASYGADGMRLAGPRVRAASTVGASVVRGMPHAAWVGRRVLALQAAGIVVSDVALPLDEHGTDTGATARAMSGMQLLPPRPLYLRNPDAMTPRGDQS